ncbi:hypothetical protein VE25_18765 [Devosia geojensis]|uniref:Uncharacterized protein n=1 Tax=Devosia geojensis TaxID=443610 RepID=A0A0F5FI02_9HYPH|nr:hypothetical protein VE25_18765 [Devosia geojensis]
MFQILSSNCSVNSNINPFFYEPVAQGMNCQQAIPNQHSVLLQRFLTSVREMDLVNKDGYFCFFSPESSYQI